MPALHRSLAASAILLAFASVETRATTLLASTTKTRQAGRKSKARKVNPDRPTAPTPDEVKKVWTYYLNGKGSGPRLVEAKLCTKIPSDNEPRAYECVAEVPPSHVPAGVNFTLWQSYLIPKGDTARIQVDLKQGNTLVRSDFCDNLTGANMRELAWVLQPYALSEGQWTLILRNGDQQLRSIAIEVVRK